MFFLNANNVEEKLYIKRIILILLSSTYELHGLIKNFLTKNLYV